MSNQGRERTNSLTHLTKIIANEVFDERLAEIKTNVDITDSLEKLRWKLSNAGDIWTEEEDAALRREVAIALEQIAYNHGRTIGAIKSRIAQKELCRLKEE